jgi:ketosteroid isomerase-like protein
MLEEDITIADFEKRVSIKDVNNKSVAFYFDNCCIFTVTQPDQEGSAHFIPVVERFYLNPALTVQ